MLTKAIIQSIDYTKNMCRVRIPLFENAARNVNIIEADAQINIVPGIYNSYNTGDIVFIGFEENKMELPVILGKLFVSASTEASSHRGNVSGNSLSITDTAQLPYSTVFNYDKISQNSSIYKDLNTPKKLADGILNLQRSQVQKYQTIIKILINEITYSLYLKTSNDFTYNPDKSDEPLYRLCTALKSSQTDSIFIPLDLVIAEDNTVLQALLQVQEFTSTSIKFKVLLGGDFYTVGKTDILEMSGAELNFSKADILEIQSNAIYY